MAKSDRLLAVLETRFDSDQSFVEAAEGVGTPPESAAGFMAALRAIAKSPFESPKRYSELPWPDDPATRRFLEQVAGAPHVRSVIMPTRLTNVAQSVAAEFGEGAEAVMVDAPTLDALRKLVPEESTQESMTVTKLRESLAKLKPATIDQIELREKWSLQEAAAEALAKQKPASPTNGATAAPPQSQTKRVAAGPKGR